MGVVREGEVIAGKFRVERTLGEGGMGYVMAARHLQLNQTVALKFMREEVCTPDYKSRFLREARNTVRLKSQHVSRVIDVGTLDDGVPYMVMEYLEGRDLSDLLHERGPFPVQEACEYVIQACEAIAEAHSLGIVHRDLKPANLFLTRGQNGEPLVKVLDFGVSKVTPIEFGPGGLSHDPDSVVTKATDLLGSPGYMAPEQIMSAKDVDTGSDLWSLGVILFRLVSGRAPFASPALGELIQQIVHGPIPSLRDARPDIPAGLEHVAARCLERDRAKRLSDAGELARMLAPYAGPKASPSLERIALLGAAAGGAPVRPTFDSMAPTNRAPSNEGFARPPAVAASHGMLSSFGAKLAPNHPIQPLLATLRDPRVMSAVALGLIMAAVIVLVVIAAVVLHRSPASDALPAASASFVPPAPSTAPTTIELPDPPALPAATATAAPRPKPTRKPTRR